MVRLWLAAYSLTSVCSSFVRRIKIRSLLGFSNLGLPIFAIRCQPPFTILSLQYYLYAIKSILFGAQKKLTSSCLLVYTRKDSKYSSKIGTLTRVILLILYTARASCASFIKLCLLIEYRSAPSSYLINSFFFIFASILHLFSKDCSFSLAMVLAYLPIKTQPIIRICFYWKILKKHIQVTAHYTVHIGIAPSFYIDRIIGSIIIKDMPHCLM